MRFFILTALLLLPIFADATDSNPSLELLSRTYHTSIKGDYLFASSTAGLTIYKLNGSKLERAGFFLVPDGGSYSIIEENYLYLFAGNSGIYRLDIKDPEKPIMLNSLKFSGSALNGDIYKGYIYVALGSTGFAMVSKENFKIIKQIETPSYCSFVKVAGINLFVSTERDGLYVYRLPELKFDYRIPLDRKIRDIAVLEDLLLLANDTDGLVILKKEKGIYRKFASYDTPDTARGVAVYRDIVLVADGNTGIVVLNFADKKTLKHIKNFNTGYSANKVAISGDKVIISNDANGILIEDVSKFY